MFEFLQILYSLCEQQHTRRTDQEEEELKFQVNKNVIQVVLHYFLIQL